jgi:hypothetical protein
MPDHDHDPLADEAAQYVLGGLNDAERAMFESRLAHSPELRAQVRELEEGAIAVALTAPRRQPPAGAWKEIERIAAQDAGWRAAVRDFGNNWWRNGWAAAAACLVGWLCYAVWMNRQAQPVPRNVSEIAQQTATNVTPAQSNLTIQPSPQMVVRQNESQAAFERQTELLRKQVAALKTQVSQMSSLLAQEQAMLAETNRIKFLQFSPGTSSDAANLTQLSPALQRALFLAMARELGWLPAENTSPNNPTGVVRSPSTNGWGVDFVDLRPGANNPQQKSGITNPLENSPASTSPTMASSTIPGFISGDNLILAIDSSIVPKGSSLTFSGSSPDSQFPTDYVVGDNSIVVTVPGTNFANASGGYTVIINGLQYSIPSNSNQ